MSDHILDSTHLEITTMPVALADLLKQVELGKPIVLSLDGKEVAAIISIQDLQLLERLIEEEEDRIDIAEAKQILAEAKEQGTIPLAEVKAKLGL